VSVAFSRAEPKTWIVGVVRLRPKEKFLIGRKSSPALKRIPTAVYERATSYAKKSAQ
jgi:hypothetical protein